MRHIDMPVGSVIIMGHPDNGRLAVKTVGGRWRLLHSGALVDPEDFRGRWDLFVPQYPAEIKVELVKRLGFSPARDSHERDCPYEIDAGNRCNCVQPETVWMQPYDVSVFRHETFDERRAVPAEQRRIPAVERF